MKKILSILAITIFVAFCSTLFGQNYYDQQWKLVTQNVKEGKYKSNLPLIQEIQKQAMKDKNAVQLIKSLKAEISIALETEDDTQNDATSQAFAKIQNVEKELKGNDLLLFQVLKSEFFMDYYNQESWEINQRTGLLNSDISKIETWTKLDFKDYLEKHFEELDKKSAELKLIPLKHYKDIFDQNQDLDYFPTLLDWYLNGKNDFLEDEDLFTPNELKANHPKIISNYDALIQANTGNPKLYFSQEKINYNCSFSNCKDQVEQLQKLVENSNVDGDYKVKIIADIMSLLQEKRENLKALTWAEKAHQIYPKSEFQNNVSNIENAIKSSSLVLHYETQTQSNKPIHLVAEHKNVDQFSINIYEVKSDIKGFVNYLGDQWKYKFSSVKKSLVRKDKFSIQNPLDYKTYKTSVEMKPLPAGIYMAEYVVKGEIQDTFHFIVSDRKAVFQVKNNEGKGDVTFTITDSETGKTVKNSSLEIFEYNRNSGILNQTISPDSKGVFSFPTDDKNSYYRNYLIKIEENQYTLFETSGRDYYRDNSPKKDVRQVQIFLDRGIYRPGQIVYFKVINTILKGEKEAVNSGISQEIKLIDANGEEISKQKFTTNDFGSYHGSFTLPSGKLNGNFALQVQDGSQNGYKNFKVEEYKRPKFEVSFDPVEGEYKYGQTIAVKGKAMMFSGVALSDATVNYEIKKKNIRWKYFWWYPQNDDNENSILGSVTTNEKGEFTIDVKLEKDESLEGIQIDNYEINASVTDINGETQSDETNIRVASVSHYIKVDDVSDAFSDENIKLNVEIKNYNDQNLAKSYTAKLSKLEVPNRIFRDNFENQIQDLPQISKTEFEQKFPHDKFDKNDDVKNWKVSSVILNEVKNTVIQNAAKRSEESTDTSNTQLPSSNLDLGKLSPGKYKLELFNIEGKDTIKTEQYFDVWSKTKLEGNQPFLTVVSKNDQLKRGEKAKLYVYSAVPNAQVRIYFQNGNGKTETSEHSLKNGVLKYEFTAPSDPKISMIQLQFALVAFNDIQTQTVNIGLEDSVKPLKIETITFRDKLQPGQKEKWTVKISGENKEAINAELLANMYDMSLDQFASNSYYWRKLYSVPSYFTNYAIRENLAQEHYSQRLKYLQGKNITIPSFNWFDIGLVMEHKYKVAIRGYASSAYNKSNRSQEIDEVVVTAMGVKREKMEVSASVEVSDNVVPEPAKAPKVDTAPEDLSNIKVRENLNETAFFYPNLLTDKEGNVSFEFTSPEALTKWKVLFLGHTKDAKAATLQKEVVTQKEFSITPNYPRFLREGDELVIQSKLSSLLNQKLTGSAQLQILDAATNEDISEKFGLSNITQVAGYNINQAFSLNENGNDVLSWKLKTPNNVSAIVVKIVAKAGNYSDGEQKAIPILPNRMLVTDALPIFVKEGQTKTFTLDALKSANSRTLSNVSNTLELTTNPIWEILFALPSLKDDTNLSADVVFNKWFADVLASEIFKANPRMKAVFDEYQSKGLLVSNLEKNQELKQLLLDETPWVLESKNETEQMAKLARLFDANTMRNSINQDWSELMKLQNADGGFSWYAGYPSSYYNSLYILKNLGKINEWLKGNLSDYQSEDQKLMVKKLIDYVDSEVGRYYEPKKENVWSNYALDYLDTRHYWEKTYPLKGKGATMKSLIISKAKKADINDFTFFGLHRAAMLFDEYGLKDVSKKLLTYLKETSTNTETQGIYWKKNLNDWGWYSSKTVNHAGALEAFEKLTPADENFIEELKIWLVTQKEVNNWGTSRSTAEVIFTILNAGKSWITPASDIAEISWGGKVLAPQMQATGYVKQSINSGVVDKNLSTVTIKKDSPGIVQGGLFWQYYEDLDKIKSSETYISITKELYKKIKTENGEQLQKISAETPLKVGDKVTVRMILNTDRNMEFIHLKDMRAAGFEPVDVISSYQWKNNLGYYQSTKDASTNFYIQYMPKGKYVFEYDYLCNAAGNFSNGITSLQNYYAPQMNAHTQGTKVFISEK